MKCDFCGYENIEQAEYCVNCGNRLTRPAYTYNDGYNDSAIGRGSAPTPPPQKSKKGLLIGILSGALSLVLIAGIVLGIIFFQMRRNTTHAATVSGNITSIVDTEDLPEDTAGCEIILYQEHADEPVCKVTPDQNGNFDLDTTPGEYRIVIVYPDGHMSDPRTVDIPDNGAEETHDIEDVITDPDDETQATESQSGETESTGSTEAPKQETPAYVADNSVVEYGSTVYFVDQNGLFSLKDGKKKTLHECKAKNLATDGKTIYYGVYVKDKKDSSTKISWNQYDLYSYDISSGKKEKVLSMNECGKPIGAVDGKLYFTDYPDNFDGNCAGLAQSLYAYDLSAKSKKLLSGGASKFDLYGKKIYFKDMTAAADFSHTQLKCYDMEKDKVTQITQDGIVDFVRVGGVYYYSTMVYATGSASVRTCRVFSNNIAKGKETLLFEKKGDLYIDTFDDKCIIYSTGMSENREYHRYTIKSKKDEVIPLSGYTNYGYVYRDGDRTLFAKYETLDILEVKDNSTAVSAAYSVPKGLPVKICRNYAFIMEGNNYYFHNIKYAELKKQAATEGGDQGASSDWKKLYTDYLNENKGTYDYASFSFTLADVDDDGVPEILTTGFAAAGTQMLWIKDGKVQMQAIGYGSVLYIPSQKRIYCQYVDHGILGDNVFSYEDHTLTDVFRGVYYPAEAGFDDPGYYVNGEDVGLETYNDMLEESFDKSQAKFADELSRYTFSEVLEAISAY